MKTSIATVSALGGILFALGCGGATDDASPFTRPASTPTDDAGAAPAPAPVAPNPTPTTPTGADASVPAPPSTSAVGMGCGKDPTRYVVLGHSVAHCFAVGGVDSQDCAMKAEHTYLAERFPGLTYENYAIDGALIADVVTKQLPRVTPGPGHIFVNLFIGGNDLAAHMYESDAKAQQSWDALRPKAVANFEKIVAFFNDTASFPDGATVIMNTQYNPFDECVAGQYSFVTLKKQGFVTEFNTEIVTTAAKYKNVTTVDQYATFLGHGHHFGQAKCPKYLPGAEGWMADLIHPNAKGHVNLLAEMTKVVDAVYTCTK